MASVKGAVPLFYIPMFEDIRLYVLALPDTEECTPFGEDILVYKLKGHIFLLARISGYPTPLSLKCDPEEAIELRARYDTIIPGYHLNKRHWITLLEPDRLPQELVRGLIYKSYQLVQSKLPKRLRE